MKRAAAAALAALGLVLAACAPAGQGGTGDGGAASQRKTLTVFAAASLKGAFTDLAGKFEAANPGTDVTLSFAGSADLVTQISQGAPADVFASADTRNMDKLKGEGLADGEPGNFATNTLTVVVPPGNPAGITGFKDLAKAGVKVVACARQVPCGAAATAIEQETGTTLSPVSEESSVTDVLGKVTSGEADAGLVYVTDAKTAGDKAEEIPFPEAANAVNTYPIAAVKGARNKPAADAFVEFVLGSEGQAALAAAGFGKP
ncbi:molybdate ABC transporter substrate-binding protein [Pseudarthrobacter sulfonivorans]|jgi:molybdate transport system substrate-binding protein|uniref:molybdate ABC transporter substrate-binding protein n=1 Tax=Pseudarthrobacter sulfonivorans TaxID=121292 RepID=UPI002780ED8B|nr:molybdate ABC transporter substrate-binding protein [Pseudarthrobacter sulfonivorans]MDP9999408.1 molybdate transport system substrate-binding protein [Pseudarthrobacter sulfonivorans]